GTCPWLLYSAPLALFCAFGGAVQHRFDCGFHAFVRVVGNALAVDVNRGRAVDTKPPPIDHVALNLLRELPAIERRIEPCAVETNLSRVLPELLNTERRLVTEKHTRVFPILTLLARRFRRFSSLARIRVLRKREVAHYQPY